MPGWEGLYAATRDGRIWSHHRQRFLSSASSFSDKGYCVVQLWRDGKGRVAKVHRLVALTWVPNAAALPEVNHIDGVKTHNAASNLEWCTTAHNIRHAFRTGLSRYRPEQPRRPNGRFG